MSYYSCFIPFLVEKSSFDSSWAIIVELLLAKINEYLSFGIKVELLIDFAPQMV